MIIRREPHAVRVLAALALCSTLGACTTPVQRATTALAGPADLQPSERRHTGHLSLRLLPFEGEAARGVSMVFDLQGNAREGALDLSTPLGTLVAAVRWSTLGASLQTSDGTQVYDSLDQLLARVLGEPLPVADLLQWLQADAGEFESAGWQVDTTQATDGIIQAQRSGAPGVRGATLKIRLDR